MKRKIYYITRTYTHDSNSGGALMREGAVKQFCEHGYQVEVISLSKTLNNISLDNQCLTLFDNGKGSDKVNWTKQRFGFSEDYLDEWANNCVNYLLPKVNKEDIVFATTGGDLASLKVASLVKDKTDCVYIANFRDPVLHTTVHNKSLSPFLHVNRDHLLIKYLNNADLVVTSCNSYKEYIEGKFQGRIINNHFGFLDNESNRDYSHLPNNKKSLNIVYAGTLNKYQGPNYYPSIFSGLKKTSLTVYSNSDPFKREHDNIYIKSSVTRDELYRCIVENHNAGFVSLSNPYFSVCVPSKIYEYINIGLPIFGFLPDGEARSIVNDNNFGYIAKVGKYSELRQKLDYYSNKLELVDDLKVNVQNSRDKWSMKHLFSGLIKEIKLLGN